MKKFITTGLILILCSTAAGTDIYRNARPPAVAGQFYTDDAGALKSQIDEFLDNAMTMDVDENILGIWVPHAGYIFSGQIAANAYAAVRNRSYDLIVLIGASHHLSIKGASIGSWSAYRTPFGLATVNTELAAELKEASDLIDCFPPVHQYEHSLEVQIPFLQVVQPGVPILPIILDPGLSLKNAERIAKTIVEHIQGKKVLIVASSDMSHYPRYKDAYDVDLRMIDAIATFDPKIVQEKEAELIDQNITNLRCCLCGRVAIATVMYITRLMGASHIEMLPYMNSGDVSGERNRVVGYGSALFVGEKRIQSDGGNTVDEIQFSKAEKKKLFQIARESIIRAIKGKDSQFEVKEKNLLKKRGVFVTLTNNGRLRGCIGHFGEDYPLFQIVSQMAAAAATQDYRFMYDPITLEEMDEINIKISVLSPLKKIDSIDEIEIGKHGIWIRQGNRGGTYLPEVATDMGWNKKQFLEHCCAHKAGLPADAWKKDADIYIYSSQLLSEKNL